MIPTFRWKWLVLAIVILFLLFLIIFGGNEGIVQPIAFNHKKHVENNVPCQFCHSMPEGSLKIGIPQTQVCTVCHEDVLYVTPEKEKIEYYKTENLNIPWRQIYRVPEHVFFSHRAHIKAGNISCESCHGNVPAMSLPFTQQVVPLKMNGCINCHERVPQIVNPYECIDCHR